MIYIHMYIYTHILYGLGCSLLLDSIKFLLLANSIGNFIRCAVACCWLPFGHLWTRPGDTS